MAYTVMLVDDEPWTVMDILHSVDWEAEGYRVVGTFDKARLAVQAIVEQRPDVVFTDIKMPVMDGFGLIQACREAGSDAQFVILSSYSEFEYAQQAIKAAVLDYCLKPVRPDALTGVLRQLRERLAQLGRVDGAPGDHFEQILGYIRENLGQKLLLSDISREFSFHRNYVCHLFKKNLDESFSGYLTRLRVEESQKLLRETTLEIGEVAGRVGMEYYYFNKVFKKYTGETPVAFRKKQKRGIEASGTTV